MKTYRAPWGRALVWTSVFAVLLLIGAGIFAAPPKPPFAMWLVRSLMGGLILIPLLFVVRGYRVTPEAILIHRLFWDTRIAREELLSAEVEPHAMKGSLRLCGNGGFYSFTGWFWSKKLGRYRAFVTDLNRTVVIRCAKRTIVVSPDDPEGFVRELLG